MRPSAPHRPIQETLKADWWSFFCCTLAAALVFWFPLTVLQVIDGMVFTERLSHVLRDLSLWWPLAAVPAALLASLGSLVRMVGRALKRDDERIRQLAWLVVLVPISWVCLWQVLRVGLLWIRLASHWETAVPTPLRLGGVLLLLVGMGIAARRYGTRRLIDGVVRVLLSLRSLAFLMLVLAGIGIASNVPEFVALGTRPPAPATPDAAGQPDIYLISLDAVAAADANVCAGTSSTMPRLQRFAAQATCFASYHASSNFTTPTTSTMETGALPWTHFATQPDARILEALRGETLAASLQRRGYRTHSITDNLLAGPRNRGSYGGYDTSDYGKTTLAGNVFRDAMSVFPDAALLRLTGAATSFLSAFDMQWHGSRNPYDSRRIYAAALDVLSGEPSAAPQFLWIHSLPPHSPYLPPAFTKYKFLPAGELERWQDFLPDNVGYAAAQQPLVDKHRLRYRESLIAADAWLGDFLDQLERQGRLKNAIMVITADHGESFEKGYLGHAGAPLHQPLIHIPLLIRLPGQTVARVVDTPTSEADLAPTLLSLVNAPGLPHAEGRSLVDALNGKALSPQPVFAMTMEHQSRYQPLTQGHFAVIDGAMKFVLHLPDERRQLFDLNADPGELKDLVRERPEDAVRLERLIRQQLARAEQQRLRLSLN